MSHTRSTEHSPQCSTPLPLSPTPPEQTEPAPITLELQNSRNLELFPPRSTSGRVLTHAIRAAATDGSPVAGFVAAAALRTRTVAARTLRTRHAGGRVIRSGTPPRSCGSCPRVRRYGFRPLGIQASCSAAARIRTASATSRRSPPTSRASAQHRACKVSGIPLPHAAAPPPFPPAGTVARDTRTSAAPLPCPRPSRLRGVACGSVRLEIPVRRHPARGRKRELIGQPAKSGEALQKASIPRGKRGVWNSVQGSGSARLGRAARLFRFLPAAGAAERGGI